MTLDEIIAALTESGADGLWSIDLPDNWSQGRTAYGGLTAALGLASARLLVDALPPLRTAQIAFVGPLGGRISFRPSLLRRGRSAAFVRVDAMEDGMIGAAMTFVFADERQSEVASTPPLETIGTGDSFEIPAQVLFGQNFDFWFVEGVPNPVDRLVRIKQQSAVEPEVEMLAIGDLLPPPALFLFPQFVPLSSMTWQIDLVSRARRSADRRWRLKGEGETLEHGLATQHMTMWDGDGRLVAKGRQLVALFG
jgi:acyl-CoA thioesterase